MFSKTISLLFILCISHHCIAHTGKPSSHTNTVATSLNWTPANNLCGGYFNTPPFVTPHTTAPLQAIQITGHHGLFAKEDTSLLEGAVTMTHHTQQLTAERVTLIRDPQTFKLMTAHLTNHVRVRDPHTLIVAKEGYYYFKTNAKLLNNVLYHMQLNDTVTTSATLATTTDAWGSAQTVSQSEPKIYNFTQGTFTTCSPVHPAWHIKGSRITLNKNTGRGHVTHMRLYLKHIPVFYFPMVDFSIDRQRKSGFLWPTINLVNTNSGASIFLPFYWNLAPNYDTTLTPAMLSKRGLQLSDQLRYLTSHHTGRLDISLLPGDRQFEIQKTQYRNRYQNTTNNTIQAELNRLLNSSSTRKSFDWQEKAYFNEHWSGNIDYHYAGDDYYLQDFGSNLSDITQNQLLQEGNLSYKNQHWQGLGRIQTYQTLHPIIEGQPAVANQYRRLPQFILNSDYPEVIGPFSYFMNSEATHFDIRNTPGTSTNLPIGNRLHLQPGLSFPWYQSFFYVNPRLQLALTDYQLYQINETNTPPNKRRGIPIFDVASGLAFDRTMHWLNHDYQQAIEPQIYYTYIPYRNQSSIPVFDTTTNTLTYDQLFNYNRFSGIDRIGDANQIGMGITMRFIAAQSGLETVRLGMGEILYFANRQVTLCNDTSCTDNPTNHSNYQRLSPLSGVVDYRVNPDWQLATNAIWNPVSKQIDNTSIGLHYQPDSNHVFNLSYSYVWNGDSQGGTSINSSQNNLKLTDFSFAYPITMALTGVGRWSEDWNLNHLQNMLAGVQYDTCCWAIQAMGGKTFTQLQNNTLQYQNTFYIQFTLKGLGNIGTGNSTDLLTSVNGYNMNMK